MDLLFDDNSPLDAADSVVAVAVNANVWSVYDYRFPVAMGEPFVGQRVRVPLGRGNRRVLGFVTAVKQHTDPGVRLKPIAEKIDVRPQLIPTVMELGRWISDYYVAPLGMTFYTGDMFPADYKNRLFITQHGSWNRTKKSGYQILVLDVNPDGTVVNKKVFASGWLQGQEDWGRPNDVLVMPDGALLISDDKAGVIYRITYTP